jgi:hypothetical protein
MFVITIFGNFYRLFSKKLAFYLQNKIAISLFRPKNSFNLSQNFLKLFFNILKMKTIFVCVFQPEIRMSASASAGGCSRPSRGSSSSSHCLSHSVFASRSAIHSAITIFGDFGRFSAKKWAHRKMPILAPVKRINSDPPPIGARGQSYKIWGKSQNLSVIRFTGANIAIFRLAKKWRFS